MPVRRPKAQRAFSIIEVMMATTILLVGFIGVMQAVTIGTEYLDTAKKLQVADQIVTAEVEKLRGSDWSNIVNLPATGAIAVSSTGVISGDTTRFALSGHTAGLNDDNTELCALAKGFSCSFTREYLRPTSATAANATYLKVTYVIRWTTNTGRAQTHQVATFLGKNGLHLSFQQS